MAAHSHIKIIQARLSSTLDVDNFIITQIACVLPILAILSAQFPLHLPLIYTIGDIRKAKLPQNMPNNI